MRPSVPKLLTRQLAKQGSVVGGGEAFLRKPMRTPTMRRVVVTGLGFITSIGNDRSTVERSLREGIHGIERWPEFENPQIPVKLLGSIKGFEFPSLDCDDWVYPKRYRISRALLRSMPPHGVFAYCAFVQAVEDAQLPKELISHPRTGAVCASGGSMWISYHNLHTMVTRGVQHCYPLAMVASIAGTLNINIAAAFGIKGALQGFCTACASSAHATGAAFELIRSGKQDIAFVVGGEDCNLFSSLPFAGIRALSTQSDPEKSPAPFDRSRDGFVASGGSTVVVLEELEHALQRGAPIYAEVLGWGEASDGYNVMAPEPNGEGLARAMLLALADAGITDPSQVDYINAHATGTYPGDLAEARAIRKVFGSSRLPMVSSTKGLTGHALSLSGVMEVAFCCLCLAKKFVPASAKLEQPDDECALLPLVRKTTPIEPRIVMSNSSGFGGSNVSIVLGAWPR
ncbi:beta-ketoacyl-[acyl-carrier-protein] synthase family protein [Candidatus Methylacidithermus pantelleriae]|uniref:3-oxoacyl-[acyl-carrier-protein] synthase 1 n=1 Tax=Candidatus Methylacidithermus pantelleriae TaxID=2744239 RepID=A0A8J2BHK5_9BACT|nr:beta-ketoacyl-[acyl-carrier-protein] synthase family protein [Candidatus Methylacidithermus pantelleriae]CAF0689789.1 3-oxoacyl-(acyl-carrier-protein) synthase 1 [Candidatus Methylacidithermus pantelleriae]